MSAAIQFDPERGEIRVGGMSYDCVVAPDGALVVSGLPVHPITLGERDTLMMVAADAERRAQRIARLIGDAAMRTTQRDALSDELRAAIEAVALQLAGAEGSGALARTTLLVARALGGFGDAVAALPAAEADRLADMLDRSQRVADGGETTSDDAGWTTITFGQGVAAGVDGPRAARDHLAALLIARDHPVSDRLAALLLAPAAPGGRGAVLDGAREPVAGRAVRGDDRWAGRPPTDSTETSDSGRWAPAGHTPESDVGTLVSRQLPGVTNTEPVTAPARPVVVPGPWEPAASVGSATTWPWLPARHGPTSHGHSSDAARHRVDRAVASRSASHAPAATARIHDASDERHDGAPQPPQLAQRSAVSADTFDGHPASAAMALLRRRSGLHQITAAATPLAVDIDVDLDAIAIALHRAADLRGIS